LFPLLYIIALFGPAHGDLHERRAEQTVVQKVTLLQNGGYGVRRDRGVFLADHSFVDVGIESHADLIDRLKRLAERSGTRVSGVFRFDMSQRTKAANAALTGIGGTRRIILGDTLLAEFTPDEVESVIAHELGHQVHRDIPVGIAFSSMITLVGLFLVSLVLNWSARALGFTGPADVGALPLLALAFGVFGLLTLPLNNAYSRWREKRADEYALEVTRKPQAFASAMTRLANQNLAEVDPEPWVELLLYSHPALNKRIAMAENYPAGN
jgi:STE24 endopeptidase